MYAVFQTGGKQYRVELGSRVDVEKLEKSPGEEIEFTEVLLVSDSGDLKIGRPYVDGATVVAKVIAQKKGKKLITFKKRRRKGQELKKGHRQCLTGLQVTQISAGN